MVSDLFIQFEIVNMHKDEAQYNKMENREIGIMIRCQHPTIIKFYGYSFKDFNNQNNFYGAC